MAYNFNLSETEKAYIAGIVDGEGSVYIVCINNHNGGRRLGWSQEFYLKLVVGNTNKTLIEYLYSKFGGNISTRPPDKRGKNYQTMYSWLTAAQKAYEILETIYPYLIIKRKHVEIARHFQVTKEQRKGERYNKVPLETLRKRYDLMSQLKLLNKFKGRRKTFFVGKGGK